MLRSLSILIVLLSLALAASCQPLPPLLSQDASATPSQTVEQTSASETCPTPEATAQPTPCQCPQCPDVLHAVSFYSPTESSGEEETPFRDYRISAQEFSANHIQVTVPGSDSSFSLITAPPIVALGRKVDNIRDPGTLSAQEDPIPWRLYAPGRSGETEITCSTEAPWYWQEVYALLNPPTPGRNVYAYSAPASEICFMPVGTTTQQMASHAAQNQIWIDVAVFDLGNDTYGLYRFGPRDWDNPAGPSACRTVCDPIVCNSAVGCAIKNICNLVCN